MAAPHHEDCTPLKTTAMSTRFQNRLSAALLLVLLFSACIIDHVSGNETPNLKEILSQVEKDQPGLGVELERLYARVPSAKSVLDSYFANTVSKPENYPTSAEKLELLWKWGALPTAALRDVSGDFTQMQKVYPEISKASRAIGAVTDESGERVLLIAPLNGLEASGNALGDIWVYSPSGAFGDTISTEAEGFELQNMNGRQVLALRQKWRPNRETQMQQVRTQRFLVTGQSTFKQIDDTTELVPFKPDAAKIEAPRVQPQQIPGNDLKTRGSDDHDNSALAKPELKENPKAILRPSAAQHDVMPQPQNHSWLVWLLVVIAATVGAVWVFLRKSK
jgi:hypothetical protein